MSFRPWRVAPPYLSVTQLGATTPVPVRLSQRISCGPIRSMAHCWLLGTKMMPPVVPGSCFADAGEATAKAKSRTMAPAPARHVAVELDIDISLAFRCGKAMAACPSAALVACVSTLLPAGAPGIGNASPDGAGIP